MIDDGLDDEHGPFFVSQTEQLPAFEVHDVHPDEQSFTPKQTLMPRI